MKGAHSEDQSVPTLYEYETRQVCLQTLQLLKRRFIYLERVVPLAKWVRWLDDHNWRFVDQLHQQLLLQKLARQITALKSVDLLLLAGYLQEVGVIYRSLDEIAEDVAFVCLGIRTGNWTAPR